MAAVPECKDERDREFVFGHGAVKGTIESRFSNELSFAATRLGICNIQTHG
jgi:hypothetical protein